MSNLTKMDWKEIRNRQEKADDRAAEVLKLLKMREAPIDPLVVAASEIPLLRVKSGDLKNKCDGMLEYRTKGFFLLLYNTKYDRYAEPGMRHPRTRFSVGHELGHFFIEEHHTYLLRGGKPHGSRSEYSSSLMIEREADAFSAALLMPKRIMEELVNDGELTLENIEAWAAMFQTSLSATARRAVELSHFPSAVVPIRSGATGMCSASNAMIEGGCYPRRSGSTLPATARAAWSAFQAGTIEKTKAQSTVGDWFQTYRPDDQAFLPVFEHYLAIPVINTMLVILTVPEDELFPDAED